MLSIPSSPSFGNRAQVTTLLARVEDATVGNKDGIVGNEAAAAGTPAPGSNNPLVFSLRQALAAGWSKHDENAKLGAFLEGAEKAFGGPVTSLAKPAHIDDTDWNAFRLNKAISLVRLGIEPKDVSDHVVAAKGSVMGNDIAARDVFVQRFAPQGAPTGKTVVVSPGFLETGRNYLEQAALLTKEGHEVVVMDHQWAGLSSGPKGGIDRGFGIARDVAAIAAWAKQQSPANETILLGTSMGGGAGVMSALALNDQGHIKLDGGDMPKGLNAVLQAPFFDRSKSVVNATLGLLGRVPGLNQVPLPGIGLPILSGDQATLRKLAAHATTEQITGRAQAFHASTDDLATVRAMLDKGMKPEGRVYVLHAERDTLADFQSSKEWTAKLGDRGHFEPIVGSTSHVFEETAGEQLLLLNGLKWLESKGD